MRRRFWPERRNLEAKKEWINELNVFPVPDGDTGTNMTLTIMAAAKEVAALEEPDHGKLWRRLSHPAPCAGARGNSGVILIPAFPGLYKGDARQWRKSTTTTLANAMVRATETAYKAVMKPKEGTILTVAKGMADKARGAGEHRRMTSGVFCRTGHRAREITC